jgi:hypothetical protein
MVNVDKVMRLALTEESIEVCQLNGDHCGSGLI